MISLQQQFILADRRGERTLRDELRLIILDNQKAAKMKAEAMKKELLDSDR